MGACGVLGGRLRRFKGHDDFTVFEWLAKEILAPRKPSIVNQKPLLLHPPRSTRYGRLNKKSTLYWRLNKNS
jgi:hypothetical protein